MSNWRVTGPWMTEDETWNELADLEMLGIHYNLEEREGQMTAGEEQEMKEEYADYAEIV